MPRAAILKHWNNEGVERDRSGRIKEKADALVTPIVTPKTGITEAEIIDANALFSATIQVNERRFGTQAICVGSDGADSYDATMVWLFRFLDGISVT